ncbi:MULTISPECIES: NADPH-dependent FMN reductase [Aerococcus]|uniref:NAD(P)H-dependent oxidoreductase n=1 Tax=Aerococcus sanguinicola TaxID=119206 RepID=A0A5N1GH60_9LACT|nr:MULTISPECIES: NADPH-dependent FMN reductase [Aerococcus]KAA9300317.1 NAD(P)H-dependent oxidoreductase [Aerococcus sanguinicola]MDK6369880.1 NADPH-dependent FMN reductase [Aerococcus sp. UMB9870]MDK6678844.1 NADPH-dependent FMN reductase [Aerococcus sp. UMB8608]MDK6686838.1 NADPH-dependent FMN reductase [Aerococcus sp. UMB8623]MDK6939502.1 NADPH-dependent FMN reductase [Aerococcus sp. UMB8487]
MNILVLSGSNVGRKTEIATKALYQELKDHYSDHDLHYLNLKDLDMVFADGRNFLDYKGDTQTVARSVMEADVIFIGTPIFQASIPASLKNVFDLLPQKGLEHKTVGIIASSGSNRHYLIPELQLKPILNYMKANVTPRYVYLNDRDFGIDDIRNDDVLFRIKDLVNETMILADTYQEILRKEDEKFGF